MGCGLSPPGTPESACPSKGQQGAWGCTSGKERKWKNGSGLLAPGEAGRWGRREEKIFLGTSSGPVASEAGCDTPGDAQGSPLGCRKEILVVE